MAFGDIVFIVLILGFFVVRSWWKVCKMLFVLLFWKLIKNRCLFDIEFYFRV